MNCAETRHIPVDKVVVESKVENEGLQLRLQLQAGVAIVAVARLKDVRRINRLAIHHGSGYLRMVALAEHGKLGSAMWFGWTDFGGGTRVEDKGGSAINA